MLKSVGHLTVFEDNKGFISVAEKNGVNERSKHIDIQLWEKIKINIITEPIPDTYGK